MRRRIDIDIEQIRDVLNYNPETGKFTWRVKTGPNARVGEEAGSRKPDGRWNIGVMGKLYLAHRLAWAYVYGEVPDVLDHIDGNPLNNAINNLRPATYAQNLANSKKPVHNKSGIKGVSWHRKTQKWVVQAGKKHVGLFDNLEDAAAAYQRASQTLYGE